MVNKDFQNGKFWKFKTADARQSPFWVWFYLHICRESSDFDEILCADVQWAL